MRVQIIRLKGFPVISNFFKNHLQNHDYVFSLPRMLIFQFQLQFVETLHEEEFFYYLKRFLVLLGS